MILDFILSKILGLKPRHSCLNKYSKVLADNKEEYPFVANLNSMARQASAERAWFAISRFLENCKKKVNGNKGFPKFKKNSRIIEYKTSGWALSEDRKYLTTEECQICC